MLWSRVILQRLKKNNTLNQLTANYKKLTVWGEIIISLSPKDRATERPFKKFLKNE